MWRLLRLLYKLKLKRSYRTIDRLWYLRRLSRPKLSKDKWYYSEWDAVQFNRSEVIIRSSFRGEVIYFYCDPNILIERIIIEKGFFDAHVLTLIADNITPGSIVLDIGANIGAYSIPLAKAFPDVEIHAFDPDPNAIKRFLRNFSLNPVKNLTYRQAAVGSSPEVKQFQCAPKEELGASSFITPVRENWRAEHAMVEVVRLDELFKKRNKRISVIKIDVQGYENEVLLGTVEIIKSDRPYIIFEHQDNNFLSKADAHNTKMGLQHCFSSNNYKVFYLTRHDPDMMFPVNWNTILDGDLVAIPLDI